ncbi:MAG TPA: pilus assembly PilX N-terminal domain-containing protein [Nitrospira sp.]|nr:pilus assembly PilX N-terminal domain-containing protein [Nitrospira sp.]
MRKTNKIAADESGIAFLTIMMLLLVFTALGVAAIAVTGLENKVAGVQRTGETAANASESCMSTSVNVIQQTIMQGQLPAGFYTSGAPITNAAATATSPNHSLFEEIMGQSDNDSDDPLGSGPTGPDYFQTVGQYDVFGDIDRMYAVPKAGTGLQFAGGYEGIGGGAAAGGVDILYRIDCRARLAATGTVSRILAVYACTMTGETCQKKL